MVWAAVADLHPLAHAMLFYVLGTITTTCRERQDVLARAFESRERGNKTTAEGA